MNRICLFLCLCLCVLSLNSCTKNESSEADPGTSIYATFYPLYIAAEWLVDGVSDVQVNCLVQPQDGCLRDYQLSDWDLALLSSADLILAGGRGLESFESVLYALGEDGPVVSSLLYNMDLRQQSGVNTQRDSLSHWLDVNPHIYMGIDGMREIVQRTANTLMMFDPENDQIYHDNLEKAQDNLDTLRKELTATLSHLKDEKVIVMNEALVYAADTYSLKVDLFYDRESGTSLYDADLDACMKALSRSEAKVVLIEKQAPQSFCEALEAAGYSVARMDILSTMQASEAKEGYFEAHRANAQAIINAFAKSAN